MRNLRKLPFSLFSLLFHFLSLGFLKLIKITLVVMQLLTLKLDDLINNLIQKVSSMGNNHNSDIQSTDILLKPDESHEIQMICRLI